MSSFRSVVPAVLCLCVFARMADAAPALDASFGTGGIVTVNAGGATAELGAALQQSDGKIVVVGNSPALPVGTFSTVPAADFLIARFNTDGTPDASFGNAGIVRIDFEGGEDAARAIVQQPDGKLVIAGWATHANDLDFAIVRLLSNGTLDASFSDDGKQLVNFPFKSPPPVCQPSGSPCAQPVVDVEFAPNWAKALALQEDGGIMVSGEMTAASRKALAFARLTASGQLDTTFGPAQDGRVAVYFGTLSPLSFAPPLVRTRSEALVAGAITGSSSLAGKVDLSASTAALNSLSPPAALPEVLLPQPDGRILVAGATIRPVAGALPHNRTWLARTDSDLVLDSSFGANGVFTTADPTDDDGINGLALERGGKILSAGYSTTDRALSTSGIRATLRRFLSNGTPDTNFATGGVLPLDLSGGGAGLSSRLDAVMTTADGKIVVAGMRGHVDAARWDESTSIRRRRASSSREWTTRRNSR